VTAILEKFLVVSGVGLFIVLCLQVQKLFPSVAGAGSRRMKCDQTKLQKLQTPTPKAGSISAKY